MKKEFICMVTTIKGTSYMIELDYSSKYIRYYKHEGMYFKKEGLSQVLDPSISFFRKTGKQLIRNFFGI